MSLFRTDSNDESEANGVPPAEEAQANGQGPPSANGQGPPGANGHLADTVAPSNLILPSIETREQLQRYACCGALRYCICELPPALTPDRGGAQDEEDDLILPSIETREQWQPDTGTPTGLTPDRYRAADEEGLDDRAQSEPHHNAQAHVPFPPVPAPAKRQSRKKTSGTRGGRKRKPTVAPSPEAEAKREKNLAKNRKAAARCRDNKKLMVRKMQDDARVLETDNTLLREQRQQESNELELLRAAALGHVISDGCHSSEIRTRLVHLQNQYGPPSIPLPAPLTHQRPPELAAPQPPLGHQYSPPRYPIEPYLPTPGAMLRPIPQPVQQHTPQLNTPYGLYHGQTQPQRPPQQSQQFGQLPPPHQPLPWGPDPPIVSRVPPVADPSTLGHHDATDAAAFDDSGIVMNSPLSGRPDKPEHSRNTHDEGENGDMDGSRE
ncbi:uncharacterized protein AB675_6426 [Cyphellophora attinorum]|uniref:BZIP domain-containing protein n=1 Tax=Cyphellophora attinorum TaxID=1664694 RepID=A0A0N1HVP9_9EURO|nr:uncharacterized protein AB675_6426 [Phialophora attinorum]KPI43956.1 hypothetical protein AB675_6426 [Phialophora attinorum]